MFCVCAVPAPATRQGSACRADRPTRGVAGDGSVPSVRRAARTTSVVRAGGVSDGSRPSVRRASRRRPKHSSNLQMCYSPPSESLRAELVAFAALLITFEPPRSSIWSVLTSNALAAASPNCQSPRGQGRGRAKRRERRAIHPYSAPSPPLGHLRPPFALPGLLAAAPPRRAAGDLPHKPSDAAAATTPSSTQQEAQQTATI